jgi:hypothetical protein
MTTDDWMDRRPDVRIVVHRQNATDKALPAIGHAFRGLLAIVPLRSIVPGKCSRVEPTERFVGFVRLTGNLTGILRDVPMPR